MTSGKVRFGLVGCGAVAHAHLPALQKSDKVELVAVVDRDLARAEEVAGMYGVPNALADAAELVGKADAAVLSIPHHLHAPIAIDLLGRGLHVLVEKPMATTAAECDAMIAAAERADKVLAVGHVRRWFDSSRYLKNLLDGGYLGAIQRFEMREGFIYDWPAASDFTMRRESGGGVLADAGVHAVDTLLWWLGDVRSCDYFDDAQGGVEADCELHLELECGAKGIVELSRTRNLENMVRIWGERGSVEVESKFNSILKVTLGGSDLALRGLAAAPGATRDEDVADLFDRQVEDVATAILEGRQPFIPGPEGRAAVALIEACHREPKPLVQPWASWQPA
ncbi:MAG: Gfo/Idh/MocA family oxidoreductase [Planctomycetota bacterium]